MRGRNACAVRAALLLATAVFAPAAEPASVTGRAMGTTWSVKWIQPANALAPAAVERQIADRLEHLEQQFSTYRPDSVLSRFNTNPGADWVPVPPELAHAALQAGDLARRTGGAFDVTVNPLVQLWGFGPHRRDGTVPAAAAIARARALVDWRKLEARRLPPALRKAQPGLTADFSSLAKGFAADAVSDLLVASGAPDHLVQIGGDVRTRGSGGVGLGWRVAIENPQERADGLAAVVSLGDEALSTSGNYRNFFLIGGQHYGHIIDPRTGRPVAGDLAAVSVIAPSAATSSARATALFVLGATEGLQLATRERWAALFLLRQDGTIVRRPTPEFARRFP